MAGVQSMGGSRRPPRKTETTARPEGGHRAAGGDAPAPVRQWPILLVLAGVALGLLVSQVNFRTGVVVVGGSVLFGGVLRAVVRNVGMLAVRSRFTDVVTYGVLGAGIVLLALTAMPDPVLDIPWMQDVMRFAVR
ncbi:hypothetical protein AQ490_08900 [Wenjunlia vitaminophila]|uniref:DUF3017 domain-containing protein n=1 Tax=Wenjunlia vitaminophila TaxID=76728 RepID=A0A0T6LLJ6_WENVI|nr:DUF3017 domain-containing protein [Wenjunlia vitaminophila]KRV46888.1 hypothetical protein AQ490_08900 [Wenjunlia vitaminophila]